MTLSSPDLILMKTLIQTMSLKLYLQVSEGAIVDLIHVGDELDALADDEEDDNQDQNPGHARLVPQVNIFLSNCRKN